MMSNHVALLIAIAAVLGLFSELVALSALAIKALAKQGKCLDAQGASPATIVNPAEDLQDRIPLPDDVLDYCDKESEPWAASECKARARGHYIERGENWTAALVALQREDGEIP